MKEIKTVPYVPLSHPLVERLIGTVRREYLDRTLFWTPGRSGDETIRFANVNIMGIEPMPDWTDACQNRVLRDLHHQ